MDALAFQIGRGDALAAVRTMERQLAIEIAGDGKGHLHADCAARDMRSGSRVSFGIDFDQSDLPAILAELDAITAAFPVIGSP